MLCDQCTGTIRHKKTVPSFISSICTTHRFMLCLTFCAAILCSSSIFDESRYAAYPLSTPLKMMIFSKKKLLLELIVCAIEMLSTGSGCPGDWCAHRRYTTTTLAFRPLLKNFGLRPACCTHLFKSETLTKQTMSFETSSPSKKNLTLIPVPTSSE